MLLWWTLAARAADCDPEPAVGALERAAIEGRVDDAARLTGDVEAALACAPVASPELVARVFLAEAVLATLGPDPSEVDDWLAAAARVAPGLWSSDYGEPLHQRYLAAAALHPEVGQLVLEPLPEGSTVFVDGAPAAQPASVPAGLHLAQAGPTPSPRSPRPSMVYARVVRVGPGELARVPTHIGEAPPEPIEAASAGRRHPVPALVTGIAAAGISAIAAGGALAQDHAMREAGTTDALDAAFGRQRALAYTSYGLLGVGAVGVGLYLAL